MVLDELLCQKAKELYGWSLSFKGNPAVLREGIITQDIWMPLQRNPKALLVRSECPGQGEEMPKSYGFLDLSQQAVVYQEAAVVYPNTYRRRAFHQELLSAVILHLKQLPEGIKPIVQLPEILKDKVHPRHFSYLEMNLKLHQPSERGRRQCRNRCRHPYHHVEGYKPLQIIEFDREDICTLLNSCYINPSC